MDYLTYPSGAPCLVQVTPFDLQVLSQAAAKLEQAAVQEAVFQQRLDEVERRETAVQAQEKLVKDREDALTRRLFQLNVRETNVSSTPSNHETFAKNREDELKRRQFQLNVLEKKAQSTNVQSKEVVGDNQQIKANTARIRQEFKSIVREQVAQSTSSRSTSRCASDQEIKALKADLQAQRSQLKAREAKIEGREQEQQDRHESHERIMAKYEAAQDARQADLDAREARLQHLEDQQLQRQPSIDNNVAIDEILDLVNAFITEHKKHEHGSAKQESEKCRSQPSSEHSMFDNKNPFAIDWATVLRQYKRDVCW